MSRLKRIESQRDARVAKATLPAAPAAAVPGDTADALRASRLSNAWPSSPGGSDRSLDDMRTSLLQQRPSAQTAPPAALVAALPARYSAVTARLDALSQECAASEALLELERRTERRGSACGATAALGAAERGSAGGGVAVATAALERSFGDSAWREGEAKGGVFVGPALGGSGSFGGFLTELPRREDRRERHLSGRGLASGGTSGGPPSGGLASGVAPGVEARWRSEAYLS